MQRCRAGYKRAPDPVKGVKSISPSVRVWLAALVHRFTHGCCPARKSATPGHAVLVNHHYVGQLSSTDVSGRSDARLERCPLNPLGGRKGSSTRSMGVDPISNSGPPRFYGMNQRKRLLIKSIEPIMEVSSGKHRPPARAAVEKTPDPGRHLRDSAAG